MSDQTTYPLEPTVAITRRQSSRGTITFEKLMDEPSASRKTPALGTDTAWAMKLKTCVDTVVRDLRINVLSAKPIFSYGAQDPRDMLFEVNTSRGPLEVLRKRSGEHTYFWKDAAQ